DTAPTSLYTLSLHDALPICTMTMGPWPSPRIVALAWGHHMFGIIPPVLVGYALLFAPHRYAWGDGKRSPWTGLAYGAYLMLSIRSEEHTSELQSLAYLVCRL